MSPAVHALYCLDLLLHVILELLQNFGENLLWGIERGAWTISPVTTTDLRAVTDSHPLLSPTLHSRLFSPSSRASAALNGLPDGMTETLIPERPKPLCHHALLMPWLLHLSICHQSWVKKYKKAPTWTVWTLNTVLSLLLHKSSSTSSCWSELPLFLGRRLIF